MKKENYEKFSSKILKGETSKIIVGGGSSKPTGSVTGGPGWADWVPDQDGQAS